MRETWLWQRFMLLSHAALRCSLKVNLTITFIESLSDGGWTGWYNICMIYDNIQVKIELKSKIKSLHISHYWICNESLEHIRVKQLWTSFNYSHEAYSHFLICFSFLFRWVPVTPLPPGLKGRERLRLSGNRVYWLLQPDWSTYVFCTVFLFPGRVYIFA